MSENFNENDEIIDDGVDYTKFYLSNYRESNNGTYDYEVI